MSQSLDTASSSAVEQLLEQQLKAWRNARRHAGDQVLQIENQLAQLRRARMVTTVR